MGKRFVSRAVVLLCWLACGVSPGLAAAPSGARIQTLDSDSSRFETWTYGEAPMGLFLPARIETTTPIVLFLHGCHNDPVHPGHWIIQALNDIEPTAVFLPTAPETPNTEYPCADWGGTYDAKIRPQMSNALHELDSLIDVHHLDASRQYLYGESMGGEGVYRLLMDFPTRFAGAVSAAGYTVNKGAAQMAQTPFWIVIGSDDEMSPVADTRAIVAAIQAAGGEKMKYTEYPDLGHVPAIEEARTDTTYLRWLLRQRRSTGVVRDGSRRTGFAWQAPFAFRGGVLKVASSLPAGTRMTLFDLEGKTLLDAVAGQVGATRAANLAGRVVLWRIQMPAGVLTGKTTLLR